MTPYAVSSDLTAGDWLPEAPTNATRLLRAATVVVAVAANRDPYTDTPTAADAVVLRDATCAQVAAWVTLGIDPAGGGVDTPTVKRTTLEGATVEYDTTGVAAVDAARDLTPQARAILLAGGLLWLPVPAGPDQYGPLPTWGLDSSRYPYSETLPGLSEQPLWGWS